MYLYLNNVSKILYNLKEVKLRSLMEQQSVTDEIMKYKELLDEGIITEKEFTIKEKELLRKTNKISME